MLPIWGQWLLGSGVIGLFISVLSLIVGAVAAWVRINRRLDRMEWSLEQIRVQTNGHLVVTGSLVSALSATGVLQPNDPAALLRSYFELAQIPPIPNNPILPEEYSRLKHYLELARQGGPFTPEQVRDYQAIVKKLQQEKPNEPSTWHLGLLWVLCYQGCFWLGSKRNSPTTSFQNLSQR